jgi:hypothetical protein
MIIDPSDYTRTSRIRGSKEYIAGRRPEASSMMSSIPFSRSTLVNLAADAGGIPLALVNRLLRKTGFVKIKSSALTLHLMQPNRGYDHYKSI